MELTSKLSKCELSLSDICDIMTYSILQMESLRPYPHLHLGYVLVLACQRGPHQPAGSRPPSSSRALTSGEQSLEVNLSLECPAGQRIVLLSAHAKAMPCTEMCTVKLCNAHSAVAMSKCWPKQSQAYAAISRGPLGKVFEGMRS